MIDLSSLNATEYADKGAKMQVVHPVTGEPIEGMSITLLGKDSTVYNQRIAAAKRKAAKAKKYGIEDAEDDALSNRIACTVAWEGMVFNGEPLECIPDNVRKIYADDGFRWLVDQVDAFQRDRSNFFPKADVS